MNPTVTEYKEGDILVKRISYSMTFYDFYIVDRVTSKQLQLTKLRKKYDGQDGFRPLVSPTNQIDDRSPEDMHVTVSKKKAEYTYSKYEEGRSYQEDHLD